MTKKNYDDDWNEYDSKDKSEKEKKEDLLYSNSKKKIEETIALDFEKMVNQDHYVDNARLTEELSKYVAAYKKNPKKARIGDYIGECIMKIAWKLSSKPNFSGYTYRDEMVEDGIENCLKYLHNFDPTKSSNGFSYLTQIIYYAFLRRIKREKKQAYIRYKIFEENGFHNYAKEADLKQRLANNMNVADVCMKDLGVSPADKEYFEGKGKKRTNKKKSEEDGLFG